MTTNHPSAPRPRYYFLDWVRILAFFLLIAYHVGMYYVSWDWHVKSPAAGTALEPFMMLSSPWRLGLLFFVAGTASSCMLTRLRPGAFARARSRRLLMPLLFGMIVVVPPQSYCEVVEKVAYPGSYLDFMRLYVTAYHGFCRDGCLILPTWNHLWFVAYLWAYAMVLALLMRMPNAWIDAIVDRVGRLLSGWRLIVLPAAGLALARLLLLTRFPNTHALIDDWYAHANYLALFLLGAVVARAPAFWPQVEALRWPALGLALAGWVVSVVWNALPDGAVYGRPWEWIVHPMRAVHALAAWSAIVAACGFARRHLDRDGPARRYLTDAVFPVYILHQTLIVVLARTLKPLQMAPGLEAVVLIVSTTVLCFTGFEAVRRVPLLRPLFGLGPQRAQTDRARMAPAGVA